MATKAHPPPCPSWRHGEKPSIFLAETVFGSHWDVTSSGTAQRERWKHTSQGSCGERGPDPSARGDTSLSLAGLSPAMVGNGGGLEMLSWGFALQLRTACEDQECWVHGCPKELVLPQVLRIYRHSAHLSPSLAFLYQKEWKLHFLGTRLAYPWWKNDSWKRNTAFKKHTAVKVLLNVEVGVMAAEYQRWKAESFAQLCAASPSFPVCPS